MSVKLKIDNEFEYLQFSNLLDRNNTQNKAVGHSSSQSERSKSNYIFIQIQENSQQESNKNSYT